MAADSRGDISPGRGGRSSSPSHSSNGAGAPDANELRVDSEEVLEIRYEPGSNGSRGTIRWADGDVYEGELKDGEPHGRGVCRYENGGVYDGDWKDGIQHGEGAMKSANGNVYEGEVKEGIMHGWGKMTSPKGVYEGEYKKGQQHGKGTMSFSDGFACEGQWMDGEPQGGEKGNGEVTPSLPPGTGSKDIAPGGGSEKQPEVKSVYNYERTLRSAKSQQRRLQRNATAKNCEHCGASDDRYKLRVCSGCNLALYCSAACQKAANRSHRRICDIISELPPRESDCLVLPYVQERLMDLDAGLRYGKKYMRNLKYLQINLRGMASGDAVKLSAKKLSSLLRSKMGTLDSVSWLSNEYVSASGDLLNDNVLKELHGLKQLRLDLVRFVEVQPLLDIIYRQKDTLVKLRLPYLQIDWSKAKTRRAVAQAVSSCKHLVRLDLAGCVLMDSDVKVMLQDLPNLRILDLSRATNHSHEFTDNSCALIARKCPSLQELDLRTHNHLSVKGICKIFVGCPHLRSFSTSTHKLSCKDVQSLLDIAPQLMYLCLDGGVSFSAGELDDIIEATGGRTLIQFNDGSRFYDRGDAVYVPKEEGVPAETRETYDRTKDALDKIWGRWTDPEVANVWEDMFEE